MKPDRKNILLLTINDTLRTATEALEEIEAAKVKLLRHDLAKINKQLQYARDVAAEIEPE